MVSRSVALLWFPLSSLLMLWDALFLLLRPHSLPGGRLHYLWRPYALYLWVDQSYTDVGDTFGYAQAWLSLAEVVLNTATFLLLLKRSSAAPLLGLFVSTATLWKALLHMLQHSWLCGGAHMVAHLPWGPYLLLFILPNAAWLVFPGYLAWGYSRTLMATLRAHTD